MTDLEIKQETGQRYAAQETDEDRARSVTAKEKEINQVIQHRYFKRATTRERESKHDSKGF